MSALASFIRRQVGHLHGRILPLRKNPALSWRFHDGIDQVSLFQHARPPNARCAKLCAILPIKQITLSCICSLLCISSFRRSRSTVPAAVGVAPPLWKSSLSLLWLILIHSLLNASVLIPVAMIVVVFELPTTVRSNSIETTCSIR
jgi:hypothetical protein